MLLVALEAGLVALFLSSLALNPDTWAHYWPKKRTVTVPLLTSLPQPGQTIQRVFSFAQTTAGADSNATQRSVRIVTWASAVRCSCLSGI